MTYGVLFEKAKAGELPPGFYYAHIPALGLTTHGDGIEGARAAAADLATIWLAEKRAAGEQINLPTEFFIRPSRFPKVPYKAREVLARRQRGGFVVRRQSGSHVVLRHADGRQTYVAMHTKDVPHGTFRNILKQASLTEDEFRAL